MISIISVTASVNFAVIGIIFTTMYRASDKHFEQYELMKSVVIKLNVISRFLSENKNITIEQGHFDTKAFARDMVLGGDVSEVEINGINYVAWGG